MGFIISLNCILAVILYWAVDLHRPYSGAWWFTIFASAGNAASVMLHFSPQ